MAFFTDHRSADSGDDGAVSDTDHRLPNTAGRLPEDPVHSCLTGRRHLVSAATHSATSGAGGSGKNQDLIWDKGYVAATV